MTASTAACSGEAKFLTRPHASRTPHGENYGDTFQSHRKPRRNRAFTSISAPQYSLEHLNIDYLLDQSIQSVAAPGKTAKNLTKIQALNSQPPRRKWPRVS